MSAEDYMPDNVVWWRLPRFVTRPACRKCGARNLNWGQTGSTWRLYQNGKPHVCQDKVPTPDDFEAA